MGGGTREDKGQALGLLTGHEVSVRTRRPRPRAEGLKEHRLQHHLASPRSQRRQV